MKNFNEKIQQQFLIMIATGKLFRSMISGKDVWDLYLASFKSGDDPIFRDPKSSEHNCNHCNNFIRRYGNIVALDKDLNIITLFDIDADEEYKAVANALAKKLKNNKINNVFFETFSELNSLPYETCKKTNTNFKLGTASNKKRYTKAEAEVFGVVKANEIRIFNHFHLDLPKLFVDNSGKSIASIQAEYKSNYDVFYRAMSEIHLDTFVLTKELFTVPKSFLNADTYMWAIDFLLKAKKSFNKAVNKENWCWNYSYELDSSKAKLLNTQIGKSIQDLSEGKSINTVWKEWNHREDPLNKFKPSAPISEKQIAEAQKFVEDNGYEASFNRRLATLDDIKVTEIKHINSGDGKVQAVSMFDTIKSTKSRYKKSEFKNLDEVSIDVFMKDILPSCSSVEAFLDNKHEGNLCTLTTSVDKESKPIFKWNNNYSKTFKGNLAGKSMIKETVKAKGGKVDGVLRFSIMWAEKDADNSDLDAHCIEPNRHLIYFSNRHSTNTDGRLDIDITNPKSQMPDGAVENITYPSISKMDNGIYKFMVHQYSARNSKGFKAEIEFNGNIFSYEYNKAVVGKVQVAEVTLNDGEFTINHRLPESTSSKEMYNLTTEKFHKVNLICLSPNHWDENAVGNKYFMFMLDKCKTDEPLRGFHNEDLLPELLKHRKVLEVLGENSKIEPTDTQLSGLGFNATVKDSLIVKLSGNFKRMLKIIF